MLALNSQKPCHPGLSKTLSYLKKSKLTSTMSATSKIKHNMNAFYDCIEVKNIIWMPREISM
jgi:hypothetical protein